MTSADKTSAALMAGWVVALLAALAGWLWAASHIRIVDVTATAEAWGTDASGVGVTVGLFLIVTMFGAAGAVTGLFCGVHRWLLGRWWP